MMDMKGNMIEMEGMQMSNQVMDMNTVMYPEITGVEKPGDEMKMSDMKGMAPSPLERTGSEADSMHQGHDMKDIKNDKMDGMKGMNMNKSRKDNMQGHNMQMPNNNSMAGMNMADENSDIVTLNYGMLRSPEKTTLPNGPWKELKFDLTGNMNRYVWSINNKTLSEADKILIKKGENVRIVIYNNTMMSNPMHLHDHDFRVINGQCDYSTLTKTLVIMP